MLSEGTQFNINPDLWDMKPMRFHSQKCCWLLMNDWPCISFRLSRLVKSTLLMNITLHYIRMFLSYRKENTNTFLNVALC